MRTMTSFRSLELRRLRASDLTNTHPYSPDERVQDRYVISEMVGSGPLGTVYKAKEAETGLDIALKVIHEPLVDIDAAEETFFEALRRVGRHEASNVLTLVPIRDGERLLTRSSTSLG